MLHLHRGRKKKGRSTRRILARSKKTEVGAAAIQDYDPDNSWTEAKE
jgi:hypothetical protein